MLDAIWLRLYGKWCWYAHYNDGNQLKMVYFTVRQLPYSVKNKSNRITVPLTVSKSAVVRNKLKRRVREILRAEGVTGGLSLYFKKGSDNLKYQELKSEITKILKTNKIK
jgi:ribonuclease P protein component